MSIISKAPGRICLFGDHQDYLGLPIIACSIDRYVTISSKPNNSQYFKIQMPDIGKKYEIHFRENVPTPHTAHLLQALSVLRKYKCIPNAGYDLLITSNVPINAGLSSSSATVVAWVQWLLHTFGCSREITPKLIGQLAYEAEVLESNSSGGKMDQYTSAIGGTIFLETGKSSKITKIDHRLSGLIIGESGVPKNTEGVLGDLKGNQMRVIQKVQQYNQEFTIQNATIDDYNHYADLLSASERRFLFAAIQNHLLTQEAFSCFRENELNIAHIGHLMSEHHKVLKDSLKITVPKIDKMIKAALDAGAYGAKIVGSGGGGSICAISPKGKEEKIINAIKNAGAKDAYKVAIAQGAHIQ